LKRIEECLQALLSQEQEQRNAAAADELEQR
jgi:hypothetical protein